MDPELSAVLLPRSLRSEEDSDVNRQLKELALARARPEWVTIRKGNPGSYSRQVST